MTTLSRTELEQAAWLRTHNDFKTLINGERWVLQWVPGKGSSLAPLDSLTDEQLRLKARLVCPHCLDRQPSGCGYCKDYEPATE